jgi:general secretion pathway protein A
MYKNFFGLLESPFDINPNPRYLVFTSQVEKALGELTYGIRTRKGLTLLTGEAGTGKTTLINSLLRWLRQQDMPVAFICSSHLEVGHLYELILRDLGVTFDSRLKSNVLVLLKQWLSQSYRAGKTAVLIVDEAQGLSFDLLEEIRMLLNLETPCEKLLQVVLAGQLEFEETLRRPELYQLKQRITLRCNTAPLNLEQTRQYIQGRLRIAGAKRECPVFSSEAMKAVHLYTDGVPRVVNLVCEQALINACMDQIRPVPARLISEVARELRLEPVTALCPSRTFGELESNEAIAAQSMADVFPLLEVARPLSDWKSAPAPEREWGVSTLLKIPAPLLASSDASRIEKSQHPLSIGLSAESDACSAAEMSPKPAPSPSLTPVLPPVGAKVARRVSPATMRGRIRAAAEAAKRSLTESGHRRILYAFRRVNRSRVALSNRCVSFLTRPSWHRLTVASFRWLQEPVRPDRTLHRWWAARRHRYLTMILTSGAWMHRTASLSRWLQEPFDPTQWLSMTPRLFAALRTPNHKKP